MLSCEQCKVWGYTREFATVEEAEEHVLYVHPLRFLRTYRMSVNDAVANSELSLVQRRIANMAAAMVARKE